MTRITDLCRGLVSLAMIVTLLAGIPTLLLVIVGFPLPTEMPSPGLIRIHVEDGTVPDLFLIKTLALVVWVVWIQLAVAFVAEFLALLRGRVARRAPVLPAVQGVAGKLVASTVLLVSAFSPQRSASAAPLVPVSAAVAGVGPGAAPPDPGQFRAAADPTAPAASTAPANSMFSMASIASEVGAVAGASGPAGMAARNPGRVESGPARPVADGIYATSSGDNWWELAERLLGDGMRWSELRALNSGRTMPNGDVVTDRTEEVRGGWHLVVPADVDPELLAASPPPDLPGAEPASGNGVVRAPRPDSLVFQGPTGTADQGPGVPYQVVEGDTLWDIAERHLGNPFRWGQIYERSTDLSQTFGRRIDDPNLIWPDSIVLLPPDAVDVPPADAALVAEVVGTAGIAGAGATVGGPDGAAAPDAGDPPSVRPEDLDRIVARAAEIIGEGATSTSTRTTSTSSTTTIPAASTTRTPTPTPTAIRTNGEADGGQDRRSGPRAPRRDGDRRLAPLPAFGAGGVLAATGLLGLLHRSRRLRLAEMGEGSIPAPPPMELVDIETVLREGSDRRRSGELWSPVHSLSDGVARADESMAVPGLIRMGSERVEAVLIGARARPPAPWRRVDLAPPPTANGAANRFALPPDRTVVAADLDALAGRRASNGGASNGAASPPEGIPTDSPTPTLVTIGGQLLVNLEAVGVLCLDGPAEDVAGLIRSLVTELATGPARRTIDLRLSHRLPGADQHPYGRSGPMAGLSRELASWLENTELALVASGASGPSALRAAGSPDALPGPVVVFADGTDQAELSALAPLVDRARRRDLPLAVVLSGVPAGGPLRASMTARIGEGQVRIEPHGLVAAAHSLDLDLVLGADALIDHARRAPVVPRPEPVWGGSVPVDHDTDPAQVPTEETPEHEIVTELPIEEEEVTDRSDDARPGVLIRVLGPVTIEGGPPDLSEEQRSVLTFLALAGPSTSEQVARAVWPGGVDRAQVEAVLAGLRDGLGHLLPTAGDGRHRLRSTATDLGTARRWITQARSASGERVSNLLQLALSDVRGAPFEGVPERQWQWIEDHRMAVATQASSLLMDACFELCDRAYEVDDLHLACWACEVAAKLDPLQETVVTRRVQLLRLLDEPERARQIVSRWEDLFAGVVGRPAPRGPRLALDQDLAAPHVG